MEKQIKIAAKLYQCRDTAKKFYGERFKEKMAEYQGYILKAMDGRKCDEMQAVLFLADMHTFKDHPMATINLMAALVEMLEPST